MVNRQHFSSALDGIGWQAYIGTMMTPAQSRAGRALIEWSQEELAKGSNLGLSTIRDFEKGRRVPSINNLAAIRRAFEDAGVAFMADGETFAGGPGVRARRLKVGDTVRLHEGTSVWGQYIALKGQVGEVVAVVDDGTSMHRVTVAYDGKVVFQGIDAGLFFLAIGPSREAGG